MTAQRADARRNRHRVLTAAREVFTEQGPEASTEDVARRAGVGVGTVFRHFATKNALLEAVLIDHIAGLRDRARELAGGAGFFTFFTEAVHDGPAKLSLAETLQRGGVDPRGPASAAQGELHAAFGALLAAAQRDGMVRGDIGVDEAYALLVGISRAVAHGGRRIAERTLAVVFDGLRAQPE